MRAEANRDRFAEERRIIRRHGGVVRMAEALRLGLTRRRLYAMRDHGVLEPLSRGVYRLQELPPLGNPDLVVVARRIPDGVVCLISALAFHELTSQIPHEVHVAIERDTTSVPRIEYPPVHIYRYSHAVFRRGIETHRIDGLQVRIYSAEKTIADIFKFRRAVGMDVVLEALKLWRERRGRQVEVLLAHARVCRVERLIRPYLEALL